MADQNPQRFLRIHEVIYKTGLTRSSVYAGCGFPPPVKIGPKAAAWVESEVEEWMAARMAARGQK
ncbi:transcriptional regulator [Burkholderia sp. AU31652]|uniref:helix-turn-helix transcriptional regulator n=1 Tax=Burkholderia TaxID=32008 RepID=UPI0009C1A543|nr:MULTISPECIES: AlpA family phage regulatory protein [Burkholderia]OXI91052.1 transcriptional regulator [Burkholderia sp. AU31652]